VLEALAPFRDDLVVGVECMFGWYWLADRCAEHQIPFVLGHALYMKLIHAAKAKNDRLDASRSLVFSEAATSRWRKDIPRACSHPVCGASRTVPRGCPARMEPRTCHVEFS
jgi:hypothetical protein